MRAIVFLLSLVLAPLAIAAGHKSSKPSQQPQEPAARQRPSLEIKGIRPGMSFDEAVSMFPSRECLGSSHDFCTVQTTLGDVPAHLQVVGREGIVDQVYLGRFDGLSFEVVEDAFKAKYGPPDETSTLVRQNGDGGKFECPVYVWNLPDGRLTISRFLPPPVPVGPSNPRLDMESADRVKRETKKEKKAASDL